jgi:DNA-binding transcriptional MerR regulator
MNRTETDELTFAELAASAGLPGRTIRFYIAKGLLPGPVKAGRGATYGREHLETLRSIKASQAKGLTLSEVARRLSGESQREILPQPTAWWNYAVADDVAVSVRADVAPWRLKQIRKQLNEMAAGLGGMDRKGNTNEHDR